jgi:F0F1-type ATP synthase membrane subunit b/b'
MYTAALHIGVLAADAAEHGYSPKTDLALWGIVAFAVFLFAIKKLGWDSLTGGMKAREEKELAFIAEAEGLRREAREKLTEHRGIMEALDEEVRGVYEEAERDADYTRRDIRALAEREAETARERARVEIRRVKDQSLNEVFESVASRVIQLTEEKLRGSLTPNDQDQLIDAALNEFARGGQPQSV